MKKLVLLDAYALIFRAYYALIRNPRKNSQNFNTSAIFGFVNTLEDIINREAPTHIGIAFDPAGPTFRHEAFPDYKAQRDSTPEDIKKSVPIIKDIIKAYNIPILEMSGYEADDVIGTIAKKAEMEGFNTYMVTPDKDYGQIVSEHITQIKPTKGEYKHLGVEEINELYGITSPKQVIDILGLMGDAVDNIPGCPGIGEKTAISLINKFGSIENIYENLEDLKGKQKEKVENNKEQVLFSKFLVTIKTDVPIEFNADKLIVKNRDKRTLREIFKKLEMQTFIKRICEEEPSTLFSSDMLETEHSIKETDEKKLPSQYENQIDLSYNEQKDLEYANLNDEYTSVSKYKLIQNEYDRQEFIKKFLYEKNVAISIATTTLNAINAKIVGMSFCCKENEAYYIDFAENSLEHRKIVESFKNFFECKNMLKIVHNLKFVILVLGNYGIKLNGPYFDTMLAHYVHQPELRHNISYLGYVYFKHNAISLEKYFGKKWEEERDMRFLPIEMQTQFCCEQADLILKLKKKLTIDLQNTSTLGLFEEIEMPLVKVLANMERNGVTIDANTLRETSRLFNQRMNNYEKRVFEIAGEKFNLSSPKQVGDILFDKLKLVDKPKKTKNGSYVTSEEVLQELRNANPIIEYILKYRGMKKLISTYLEALPALVNSETGHIHTTFNQAVTATGRLSCSNPNLQNIPIRGEDGREIRKAFIPEKGSIFFSADYSQIELRIMAHLSKDTHMIDAFNKGYDIHSATAARIFHKKIEEINSDERRKAKTANFGIIYGITTFGLSQRIGISRSEAKELIDNYFKMFPGIYNYMEISKEEARKKGYVETIFHRRRYLPDILSKNATVRGYAERNAINAPIQGSAADIIKIAMIAILRRFEEENIQSKLILQVHDELNFSVLPEEKEKVENIVRTEMQQAYNLSVPLVADCGWGNNWLEAH